MVEFIKEILLMDKYKVMQKYNIINKEPNILESLNKVKNMEKESIIMAMEEFGKVNGLIIDKMESENLKIVKIKSFKLYGLMESKIKIFSTLIKNDIKIKNIIKKLIFFINIYFF